MTDKGFFRSHPISLFTGELSATSGTFYTSSFAATVTVVTFIGLVNRSNGTGDSIVIVKTPSGGSPAAIHSGYTGQGTLDRFPLALEVAMNHLDTLGWAIGTGTWDVVVTGYLTPLVVGF